MASYSIAKLLYLKPNSAFKLQGKLLQVSCNEICFEWVLSVFYVNV